MRDVPVDDTQTGSQAREVMPVVRQIFIARRRLVPSAFESKLYVIRKLVENRVHELGLDPDRRFHVASLSAETIVYKGLLLPEQLPKFYGDLGDPEMKSALALVHSRFSTNTFPTWTAPSRSDASRTTARSTPCRATATGCARGAVSSSRGGSGASSSASSPSSTATAATRRNSTTWSSCSPSAAAACPRP